MRSRLNFSKALILMVTLSVLQTIGLIIIVVLEVARKGHMMAAERLYMLPLLLLISLAGTVVVVSLIHPMLYLMQRLRQAEDSLKDIAGLNKTLKAQRHDFMNHLQVVFSLIEFGEFAEAKAYIEKEYENVEKVSGILKTESPAINAILQAKRQMCQSRGIDVEMDIRSALSELPVPAWEFCRVLGNIIDNAIHALAHKDGEKILSISIFEDLQYYRFKIKNNGPTIDKAFHEKIFDAGFSLSENGDGMGLAICRKILCAYGGSISVESDEAKTVFTGMVPRKSPARRAHSEDENDNWSI
ncbi:MAG: GHKL domain-containing protein [Clostridiales bacterium]|nr:GHKL domain-containing protein [Clostridiales bacterium]